tara:strand:+ start:99 stop:458 length:360 start_codon:yes stop_codon:yes gene_type:complete
VYRKIGIKNYISKMVKVQSFPTFSELKKFIEENPKATICEIRNEFKQEGEDVVSIKKPNCKKKELIVAYSINGEFYRYLQSFMKEEYVICDSDHMACLISDDTRYIGPGEFFPIVLSIK